MKSTSMVGSFSHVKLDKAPIANNTGSEMQCRAQSMEAENPKKSKLKLKNFLFIFLQRCCNSKSFDGDKFFLIFFGFAKIAFTCLS